MSAVAMGCNPWWTIKNAFPTENNSVFYPTEWRKLIRLWAHGMNWYGIIEVCNLEPKFPITNQLAVTVLDTPAWFGVVSQVFLNSVFNKKHVSQAWTCPRWRLNENTATSCICFELCSLRNRWSCDGFVFLRLSGCSLTTSDTFGTLNFVLFPTRYQNPSASLENPDRQSKADVSQGAHWLFILLWSRLFLKIDHLCCLLMPQSCKDLVFRPTNTNEEMEKQRKSPSAAPIKQRAATSDALTAGI